MATVDRSTARALAEAGYMPVAEYLRMFGDDIGVEPVTKLSAHGRRRARLRSASAAVARHGAGGKHRHTVQTLHARRR
ncbi:MAG: hypothetical protein ACREQD_17040 [Candidatus Binataceae bacterium]